MLQPKIQQKSKNVTFSDTSPSRFNRKYVAPQASFRQCTLVKTVPDTSPKMPTQTDSVAQLKQKQEAALVSDKVTKTKNEIEQLKAELEQLITRGITEGACNLKVTAPNENEQQVTDIKAKTFKDNIADLFNDPHVKTHKIYPKLTKSKPIITKPELEQPKKVRHYDQDVAREYIKKQKEKRRGELLNKKKDVVSNVDLKKQRLQELREKSLKLLSKNVNRARSLSRERKDEEPVEIVPPANERISSQISQTRKVHPQLGNITMRLPHSYCDVDETLNRTTTKDDREIAAATKIQALFRGYRQRKLLQDEPVKELICKEVQTSLFELPKPEIVPYPYNFISAVRRKLNLVARQAKANASSVILESPVARKSPDLKSFLSDKCLNLDVKSIEHLTLKKSKTGVENGCASESDTSKNIPDLSSESSTDINLLHSSKRARSSDTDEERGRKNINVDRVKKLKLRQPKSIESEISERINGSKESIISSNRCNYAIITSKKSDSIEKDVNTIATEKDIKIQTQKDIKIQTEKDGVSTEKIDTDVIDENINNHAETYSLKNKENVSENILQVINNASQEYSSNFASVTSDIPALQPPSVSLKSSLPISSSEESVGNTASNRIPSIVLKHGEKSVIESKIKANEIHLKFEAELHLLNDFNDSLRQVMAVEKSLLELHNQKNETAMTFHTRDTQTSIINPQSQIATINYSRGSDITEAQSIENDVTLITTGLELSQFNSPIEESCSDYSIIKTKRNNQDTLTGLSLEMFERLIKDEDARIENLKAILKIREKALVDRTKGELAWLEIQKKHLKDGGQLQEISAIKKKQRGLLIKLEHERHEMQRLKQMQKAASKERKSVLKEQRNMIKAQLSTGGTVTKIKRHAREEKRQSGPFKVYNIKSHNDTIFSETSMTRKSSVTEEIVSEVSHRSHSVVSQISEEIILSEKLEIRTNQEPTIQTETVKRSLLMREAALQKRRKVAEEILQWHQRLLEEEKKISELELAATSIINQASPIKNEDLLLDKAARQKFKGSQLNQLWLSMTGRQEKKFKDEEVYNMSQTSLEKFCRNAKHYEKLQKRNHTPDSRRSSIPVEENHSSEYLSDFESAVTSDSPPMVNGKFGESSESDEINTVTEISKQKTTEILDHKISSGENVSIKFSEEAELLSNRETETTISRNIKTSNHDLNSIQENQTTSAIPDIANDQELVDDYSNIKDIEHNHSVGDDVVATLSLKINSQRDNSTVHDETEGKVSIGKLSDLTGSRSCNVTLPSAERNVNVTENLNNTKTIGDLSQKSSTVNLSQLETNGPLSKINTERGSCVIESDQDVNNDTENDLKLFSELNKTSEITRSSDIPDETTTYSKYSMKSSNINTERGTSFIDSNITNQITLCKLNTKFPITKSYSDTRISDLNNVTETLLKSINVKVTLSNNNEDASSNESPKPKSNISDISSNLNENISPSQTIDSISEIEEDQVSDSPKLSDEPIEVLQISSIIDQDAEQMPINAIVEELPALISSSPSKTVDDVTGQTSPVLMIEHSKTSNHRSTEDQVIHVDAVENKCEIASEETQVSKTTEEHDRMHLSSEQNENESVDERILINEESSQDTNSSAKQTSPLLSSYGFIEAKKTSQSDTIESTVDLEKSSRSSEDPHEKIIDNNYNLVSENEDKIKSDLEQISNDKKNSSTPTITISLEGDESKSGKIEDIPSDKNDSSIPTITISLGDENKSGKIVDSPSDKKNLSTPTITISLEGGENKNSEIEDAPSEQSVSEKIANEKQIDVKKRVLEILSDANISSPRGDRSPRMQDFYVTAYDVTSPNHSPNSNSPTEDVQSNFVTQDVTDEVEELLKKQIAIEREIKEIQQQQKEHLPYLYVREIPNKPPPPYTPPTTKQQAQIKDSILPISEKQIDVITKATSEILHKAFKENNLRNVTLSENSKKILDLKSNVDANCYEFLFDLSKEMAIEHYKQFEAETGPSWMHLHKRTKLAIGKPFDQRGLDRLINKKIKQVLGFEIVKVVENKKHKWSGKKRDHVDELLVVECQAEEAEWTNYNRDELIVKDELTKEILNMLLSETGQALNNVLKKKNLS
ncbi:hypothetical protein RI129_008966 [Pyrocoelia pectoralis]|uniref:Uncharacterized protein n=1 Tax=Pyrocoelia pectoralis TaxID=417401 RepID=A0AAN7VG64_9COLE